MSEPRDPKRDPAEAEQAPEREGGPDRERHPLAKAAWDGYRQYREEMDQRSFFGSVHKLGLKDTLMLGVILLGIFGLLVFLAPD
jgi:hypothetical protein